MAEGSAALRCPYGAPLLTLAPNIMPAPRHIHAAPRRAQVEADFGQAFNSYKGIHHGSRIIDGLTEKDAERAAVGTWRPGRWRRGA